MEYVSVLFGSEHAGFHEAMSFLRMWVKKIKYDKETINQLYKEDDGRSKEPKKVKRVKDKSFESWVITECGYEFNGPNIPTLEYNIGL
jgi:hypothetical protein